MIEVLSVDDHALLREGIAALVNAESDMKLVAEATNGQEAIEKFRLHRARQVFCVNGHTVSNSSSLVDWADLSGG
jgi:DNA-binding NarL/FixJ family response regulator